MYRVYVSLSATIFLATVATASPLPRWSGAGPNACRGACSQEWAIGQLNEAERAELAAARIAAPDPQPFVVENGDVFTMMSYQKKGRPVAYRTYTVADLGEPELAHGWSMNGWSFVRLEACGNWAIVNQNAQGPAFSPPLPVAAQITPLPTSLRPTSNRNTAGPIPTPTGAVFSTPILPDSGGPIVNTRDIEPPIFTESNEFPEPLKNPPISPVPIPASFWALIMGVMAISALGLRLKSVQGHRRV
ncbi:hypothetical protein OEZ49_08480 [Ruegeria sp. WL0004]|uniref:Uncharacterized protein n=1 Tax=Ruegeria marisflavi TaxID=2984152 RepID=A0ABT2WPG9_9RHOB|nr:hypothetical protein [Ruegeria sp. WL0004]MCU9837800.1 hypothetical protein [Ruegeria sp. WL0004]